jgi:hypothetical protein
MGIIEMDPADVLKAIAGYQNELDPERKALDAFYRQFKCKRCSGDVVKEYAVKHAFNDPDTLNPRALLRCTRCKCLFDPHSGVILELGDMTQTPSGIPLVGQK